MDCLFCKFVEKTLPITPLYEDRDLMAFRDINPQAPTHILIIPKKHISSINTANADDAMLLGKLLLKARDLAKAEGIDESGFRLNINTNDDGGQTVFHLHLHLIGGRPMAWPPG